MLSVTLMNMLEPVALNYKRTKRKNAIIAGSLLRPLKRLGVNYPLNSIHKERKTKQREPGVFNGVFRFYISHLTFHLHAIVNFPATCNQCYRPLSLALY